MLPIFESGLRAEQPVTVSAAEVERVILEFDGNQISNDILSREIVGRLNLILECLVGHQAFHASRFDWLLASGQAEAAFLPRVVPLYFLGEPDCRPSGDLKGVSVAVVEESHFVRTLVNSFSTGRPSLATQALQRPPASFFPVQSKFERSVVLN